MLTKLLVTLLVAAIGWKVISNRQRISQAAPRQQSATTNLYTNKAAIAAAILLIVAVAVIGWQWWLGFEKVHVTIVSPQNGNVDTYIVRKRDIGENKIVTIDGITIRLSQEERIEIAP